MLILLPSGEQTFMKSAKTAGSYYFCTVFNTFK